MAEPLVAPHMVLGAGGNGPAVITYTNGNSTIAEIVAPGFFGDPQPSSREVKEGDFMFVVGSDGAGLVTIDETHPSFVLTLVARS